MHPHLSWDCDIMCCASPVTLPAGQAKHNTHTDEIVWTTTGGWLSIHYSYPSDGTHCEARHTLTPTHAHTNTHTYIQIQPLYHISGRAGKSYIPVYALVFSCTVIKFPRLSPVCYLLIHIHVESDLCQRALLQGGWMVVGGARKTHSKHTHTHKPSHHDAYCTNFLSRRKIWQMCVILRSSN